MEINVHKISSSEEFQKCLNIRISVFIKEQGVSMEDEIDGMDKKCDHYLLTVNNLAAGTARVRFKQNTAKIERLAVLPEYRKQGVGKHIIKKILSDMAYLKHINNIMLSAQSYIVPFYEKLGFAICSSEYIEAGIPHKDMKLKKNLPIIPKT